MTPRSFKKFHVAQAGRNQHTIFDKVSYETQGVAESVGRSKSAIFGRDKVSYENVKYSGREAEGIRGNLSPFGLRERSSSEFRPAPSTSIPWVYYENTGYRGPDPVQDAELPVELDILDLDRNIAWVDKLVSNSDELRSLSPKGDKFPRTPTASPPKYFTDSPESPRKFRNIMKTPYRTPPPPNSLRPTSRPSYYRRSPPKLTRHQPGSNIWIRRNDGMIVNQFGCVLPTPVRLLSENIHDYNFRALEEGISRGYVNVRRENVDLNALEEGIARGYVARR